MADEGSTEPRRYGTFEGVFVPTLLTILGVILYLRTGWVVGNAGLAGAILIILLGYTITGTTGLSIASIATNTPLGGGGAYAIISRSLGVEAGGAIGVPLYLSQTLAIVLYIFGFRGGWEFIFPGHPDIVVDVVTFVTLMVIASVSARFAFRVQCLILTMVALSLVVIVLAAVQGSMTLAPTWWGAYPGAPEDGFAGADFWSVFAVFFPATTRIMAGVNISGELRDSRRSIPLGTLSAIGLSLLVYLGTAAWLALSVLMEELASDYLVILERSAWGPGVVAGLLGATFSSGLASMVGAPRILQALGEAELLPGSRFFAQRTAGGEPATRCWSPGRSPSGRSCCATSTRSPDHHAVLPDHLRHDQPGGAGRADARPADLPADPALPPRRPADRGGRVYRRDGGGQRRLHRHRRRGRPGVPRRAAAPAAGQPLQRRPQRHVRRHRRVGVAARRRLAAVGRARVAAAGARAGRGSAPAAGRVVVPARRHVPQGQRQGGRGPRGRRRPGAVGCPDDGQSPAAVRADLDLLVDHRPGDLRGGLHRVDARLRGRHRALQHRLPAVPDAPVAPAPRGAGARRGVRAWPRGADGVDHPRRSAGRARRRQPVDPRAGARLDGQHRPAALAPGDPHGLQAAGQLGRRPQPADGRVRPGAAGRARPLPARAGRPRPVARPTRRPRAQHALPRRAAGGAVRGPHIFSLSPDIDFEVLGRIIDAAATPCVFVRDSGDEHAFI